MADLKVIENELVPVYETNVKKYWNTIWMAKYLMMNLFQEIKNM